jgi:hypothetical protein
MTARRLLPRVALVVALAIIAVLWGIQLEANRRLREQTDAGRHLAARLALLEIENFRLSNIVAQANAPLSDVQLAELEKLREEVQQLRHRTNDLQTLQAEVRRLRSELSDAHNFTTSNAPPDVPPEDVYPRDTWKFAGYDTPENTLESVTWAISQGDEDTYLAGLSPDLRDQMQSELADGSFADVGPLEMNNTTGFRIADREIVSDNQVIYTLYMDGDGDELDMVLEYIDGAWVVVGEGNGQ